MENQGVLNGTEHQGVPKGTEQPLLTNMENQGVPKGTERPLNQGVSKGAERPLSLYLILSCDGGGARMILQWKILQRILKTYPRFLSSVSLFAGTSAGSILASALACGMAPYADSIFTEQLLETIFQASGFHAVTSIHGLLHAKYQNDGLKSQLENYFGAYTMDEVPRALFIPAFDTRGDGSNQQHLLGEDAPDWMNCRCKRWHSVFFHNIGNSESSTTSPVNIEKKCNGGNSLMEGEEMGQHSLNHQDEPLVQAILKSCAAPTYFPLVGSCVDGGIAHNNPSLAALTHLLALGIPLEDIYILSLGTGEKPEELEVPLNSSLGVIAWMPHIISMMFDANQEAISQSCSQILGSRFHRINPVLSHEIPLDEAQSFPQLVALAEQVDLSATFDWVRERERGADAPL
jgi:patatin-like phospholipase/acyl hydrolase